jgi:D-3-phosphoglycerate dehydrogenase
MMKQSSILVNTARGEVVDEKALIEALQSGKLKCAGLDTFAIEPIESDSPLLKLENVILTPHMAVQTTDAVMRFMRANGEQVENALNGTYANVVNPEVLGKLACS